MYAAGSFCDDPIWRAFLEPEKLVSAGAGGIDWTEIDRRTGRASSPLR
jgi:hypothetical protein